MLVELLVNEVRQYGTVHTDRLLRRIKQFGSLELGGIERNRTGFSVNGDTGIGMETRPRLVTKLGVILRDNLRTSHTERIRMVTFQNIGMEPRAVCREALVIVDARDGNGQVRTDVYQVIVRMAVTLASDEI